MYRSGKKKEGVGTVYWMCVASCHPFIICKIRPASWCSCPFIDIFRRKFNRYDYVWLCINAIITMLIMLVHYRGLIVHRAIIPHSFFFLSVWTKILIFCFLLDLLLLYCLHQFAQQLINCSTINYTLDY